MAEPDKSRTERPPEKRDVPKEDYTKRSEEIIHGQKSSSDSGNKGGGKGNQGTTTHGGPRKNE